MNREDGEYYERKLEDSEVVLRGCMICLVGIVICLVVSYLKNCSWI